MSNILKEFNVKHGALIGTSSANYLKVSGSDTGNPVSINALGSDTNISISLVPKGNGTVNIPSTGLNMPTGNANSILYLNGSKDVTTNAGLTFNGTTVTTSSSIGLSIGGNTIANKGIQAGSNGTPIYQTKLDFLGDVAGSWRKLVSVSIGTGLFQNAAYKIDIVDPNSNNAHANSVNADKYTYYVSCDRSDGTTQDVPDACYISGPANHIRAVKLSTGNYEIQVSNEIQYQEYLITVQLYTENGGLNAATYFDGSVVGSAGIATYTAAVGSATDWFQQVGVASNGSGDALRITQTGGGNALVVEDETNPDSTPFVITGGGQTIIGFTAQVAGPVYNPKFQVVGSNPSQSGIGQFYYNNDSLSAWYQFNKTRATAPAGHVIVANNDELGVLTFAGSDGTGYIRGASIAAYVDGTPGTNDMPGRLVFSTTADGASAPTEAMRINNAQNVGIGTSNPSAAKLVVSSTSGKLSYLDQPVATWGTVANFNAYRYIETNSGATDGNFRAFHVGAGGVAIGYSNTPVYGSSDAMYVNGNVGIGTTSPAYKLHVVGSFAATTKSFVIDHPTKSGMKLRYGSLEGPENGVYVRGRTQTTIIELPDYWTGLVDSDSITVNLTPIGSAQNLYVEKIQNNCVYIAGNVIDCFYTVYGERKDVEKLLVEF